MDNGQKAIVQLLFASGQPFTVDSLRTTLRELFREEANAHIRKVASYSNQELIAELLVISKTLENSGLKIQISNGTVELKAGPVLSANLKNYLSEKLRNSEKLVSDSNLEVLACIAFKQPIMQAEIERIFESDKRWQLTRLELLGYIESVTDSKGFKRWITTPQFNTVYGSPQELRNTLEQQILP